MSEALSIPVSFLLCLLLPCKSQSANEGQTWGSRRRQLSRGGLRGAAVQGRGLDFRGAVLFPRDLSPVLTYSGRSQARVYLSSSLLCSEARRSTPQPQESEGFQGRPGATKDKPQGCQSHTGRRPESTIPSTKEHSGPTTFSRNVVASMNIRLWGVTETDRGRGDEAP